MTIDDAIQQACATVGIITPRVQIVLGKWVPTDTTSGKNGKGDGRIIVNETHVTAFNWQTGETATVSTLVDVSIKERKEIGARARVQRAERRQLAERAATDAKEMLHTAKLASHPYLDRKSLYAVKAAVIAADDVKRIAGRYLVPDNAKSAIVVPARVATGALTSCQLIWEDGTKKFLYGGAMAGAAHRLCKGNATWLCEGFATGVSIRAALSQMKRSDGVLVCFSASNIAAVARSVSGPCFIAADHDSAPKSNPDQFSGLGAGEHYARQAGKPYAMPHDVGTDFDDMRQADGLFAVQAALLKAIRGVRVSP